MGIGFLAFSRLGLSCLIAFFRLSSDAGLATALASPCQESSSLRRMARDSHGFWLHHVANPPNTLAKALAWVGDDVRGEVWFGSFLQRLIVL